MAVQRIRHARIPRPAQRRLGSDTRFGIPQLGAEDPRRATTTALDQRCRGRRVRAAVGDQDGIIGRLGREPRDRAGYPARSPAIGLERDDLAASTLDRAQKRGRCALAIQAVGHQPGEIADPALPGKIDHPFDRLGRDIAHQIRAIAGNAEIVRKAQHRDAGRTRDRRDGANIVRQQRPEDQLRTLGDRPLCRRGRARRGIVIGDPDALVLRVEQRHHRRIGDRRAHTGIAARQRHQQRDPVALGVFRDAGFHPDVRPFRGPRGRALLRRLDRSAWNDRLARAEQTGCCQRGPSPKCACRLRYRRYVCHDHPHEP